MQKLETCKKKGREQKWKCLS